MVINRQITPFPHLMGQLNGISPLTYRDGATFLKTLEELIRFIQEGQTPEIQAILDKAFEDFQKGITNAENTIIKSKLEWQQFFDDFIAHFQDEIKLLNDQVISDLADNPTTKTGSSLRHLFADKSIQTLVETGRLSQLVMDAQYANKTDTTNSLTTTNNNVSGIGTRVGALETWRGTATTDIAAKIPSAQRAAANGVATLDSTTRIPNNQLRETSSRGTYLNRPAANTVPNGYTYHAYDVMESYISDGLGWFITSHGGIFSTVKLGQSFSTTNNGPIVGGADVPGMSITFTAGGQPIEFDLSVTLANSAGNAMTTAAVMVDGSFIGLFAKAYQYSPAEKWLSVNVSRVKSFTPGSVHTAKVQLWWDDNTGGSARAIMDANSTFTIKGA